MVRDFDCCEAVGLADDFRFFGGGLAEAFGEANGEFSRRWWCREARHGLQWGQKDGRLLEVKATLLVTVVGNWKISKKLALNI